MNKKIVGSMLAGVLIAGVAFGGGFYLSQQRSAGADPRGAFGKLSQADRESMASMTDEQRQAFLKDKGIELPNGTAPGGAARAGGPGPNSGGVQLFEGTVSAIEGDKVALTLDGGGSANVYIDEATVLAAVDGASPELAANSKVMVFAKAEAAGVDAATAILVR